MKCKICNKKTTWDISYGYSEFIVCPCCHNNIYETIANKDLEQTMRIIFALGDCAKKGVNNV